MEADLDPYHEFLGIPPHEQPPNHYRLLGVSLHENDDKVLESQYEMRRNYLRTLFATDFANLAQRLLDEVAQAMAVLRDPELRREYDRSLSKPGTPGIASASRRARQTSQSSVWLVGSKSDCDIVVTDERVSRLHCRLTQVNEEFYLHDAGSRNGTFVNGDRVTERVRVSPDDLITLGQSVRMPWPAAVSAAPSREVRIGRAPDNDWVLDDDSVSAHHAVARFKTGELILEDLSSTNGTAVGSRENRITSRGVRRSDILYFGAVETTAEQLWRLIESRKTAV